MKRQVGYLINYPEGLTGERGIFYNYITGSNGVFIEAESPLVSARIPIADCEFRGLAPVEKKIGLLYGSIPQRFFDLTLDMFLTYPDTEQYVAVTASNGYHFYIPNQDRKEISVVYDVGRSVILEFHSHGHMEARFSGTDNKDETGLKFYGVIGKLKDIPIVKLRIGVYGYFHNLAWKDIFDGSLCGALENEIKEVIDEGELYSIFP